MSVDLVLVGFRDVVDSFPYHLRGLEMAGFMITEIPNFSTMRSVLKTHKVALILVAAFGDNFRSQVDSYKGKLPPILYWYLPNSDKIPTTRAVSLVSTSALPDQLVSAAKAVLALAV